MQREQGKQSLEIDPDLYTKQVTLSVLRRLIAYVIYHSGRASSAPSSLKCPWSILRYQRIANPESRPYPISINQYVRPRTLEKHFQILSRDFRVISLSELLQLIDENARMEERTVALTFDGGFADFYALAFPLLKKYALPATVFLPTAFIGTNNMFWPEKLMAAALTLLIQGHALSTLPFFGEDFPDLVSDKPEDYHATVAKMGVVINRLRRASADDRTAIIIKFGLLSDEVGGLTVEREFLSWEEVRKLAEAGIEFGFHGHTFREFSEVPPDELGHDIRLSVKTMVDNGIHPLMVLSYPRGNNTKEARRILSTLHIRYSLSLGNLPPSFPSSTESAVLGRIPIYEQVADTGEIFACRVLGAGAFGFKF